MVKPKPAKKKSRNRSTVIGVGVFVVVIVSLAVVYLVYFAAAGVENGTNSITGASSSASVNAGTCSSMMGRHCFLAVEAAGAGNFLTGINGTAIVESYTGENTNLPRCGTSCFSIQLNSNRFDDYGWVQIIMSFNYSQSYGLTTYVDYQILWLEATQPSSPCQGALGWQWENPANGNQFWLCDNKPSHQYTISDTPTIPTGSQFSVSTDFEANGTVRVNFAYWSGGVKLITQTLDVTRGPTLYGKITAMYQVIVGAYAGNAEFSPGSKFLLRLAPTTSIGNIYPTDWYQGGTVLTTAETSNLGFDGATYSDNVQVIEASS